MQENSQYTTSVNIIRDENRNLSYYPTPNAIRVINQIANDYKKGLRSFNVIGTYGTGKSSFLWAFEQSLSKKKSIFDINLLSTPTVKFINFIGEYKSIIESFASYFKVENNQDAPQYIISEIYNQYHDLGSVNPLLVVVIDELGKFLEYASRNEPERELYFIQQLTEFVNNSDHNICLLTTVHQNFDTYAFSLSPSQRQEWSKVKGRLREITFNEPVEQLLFLAAQHLENHNKEDIIEDCIKKVIKITKDTKAFNLDKNFVAQIASKLYPLDLLAANILTICLQKYGQNERSLFSFLESTDHTGLNSTVISSSNPFYNIANVYDYITYNFYSFINSRNNPDYFAWMSIKNALESVERSFDDNLDKYDKLVKTIGLLSLIAPKGSVLDEDFLTTYAKTCLGIKDAGKYIDNLDVKKLILYRNYNKRFILFDGTDLDIQLALNEAANKVSEINDVVTVLKRHFQLSPIFAKMYSYENGTPRLFEYIISDHPLVESPVDEVDGFINLVFNENLTIDDVKEFSLKHSEAIVYGFYHKTKKIKEQLFEIAKTQKVIEENIDDKVASKELEGILTYHTDLLNQYIIDGHYSEDVTWIVNGQEKAIATQREFNKLISQVCFDVYNKTPIFKNELVNKHRISNTIHKAKRNYFKALANNWGDVDLGFTKDLFPPEKTIYLTLLKNNGIDLSLNKSSEIQVNSNNNFEHLWQASIDFLEDSKTAKRRVSELSTILSKRPFKLKQGLIDFWVSSFLFIKRNDYALFGEFGYIPVINEEVLELITKYPKNYELKTFSVDGIKLDMFNSYRALLNQTTKDGVSNETFVETIRPFLKFYKELPEYSKNTRRLATETLAIRAAISSSKDPEQTFFSDFPIALGFNLGELQNSKEDLKAYTAKLQEAIRELRASFEELVNRVDTFIQDEIIGETVDFEIYKERLQKRYQKLKKHLLIPSQKTFVQRLDSQLDDRTAWLSSLVQALTGTTLEKFKDSDEAVLFDRFKSMIINLDSLTKISKTDFSEEKEDVISLEINSLGTSATKKIIRLPKSKNKELKLIEDSLRLKLSEDQSINIAALTNLLKELLKND